MTQHVSEAQARVEAALGSLTWSSAASTSPSVSHCSAKKMANPSSCKPAMANCRPCNMSSSMPQRMGDTPKSKLTITECRAKYCVICGRSPTVFISSRVMDRS